MLIEVFHPDERDGQNFQVLEILYQMEIEVELIDFNCQLSQFWVGLRQ